MSIRSQFWLFTLPLILFISASAQGQEMTGKAAGQNVPEMKFTTMPGLPTCATGSVQSGDPGKGPSIILAKVATGCAIPWHWHMPIEHLMMVSGVARLEMKDGKPLPLRTGGFAKLPSRHVHQFRCERACLFYVYSDGAFDIHYVNAEGKEITPEEAHKAVKQTAATEAQR